MVQPERSGKLAKLFIRKSSFSIFLISPKGGIISKQLLLASNFFKAASKRFYRTIESERLARKLQLTILCIYIYLSASNMGFAREVNRYIEQTSHVRDVGR